MHLDELAPEATPMSEAKFCETHRRASLVFEKVPGTVLGTGSDTPRGKLHWEKTDKAVIRPTGECPLVLEPVTEESVHFLEKTMRNSFTGLVVLGREPKCDLILISPVVSKVHLIFMQQDGGSGWTVVDPGSSNGTAINGTLVEPRVVKSLWDGDEIVIAGEIRAIFHTPQGLFKRLALAVRRA